MELRKQLPIVGLIMGIAGLMLLVALLVLYATDGGDTRQVEVVSAGAVPVQTESPSGITHNGLRTVSVTGTAEVKVTPDQAVLTLGAVGKDTELRDAKRECDEMVAGVIEAAKDHGVDDDHIKTEYLRINPDYDYGLFRTVIKGYEASQTISIILTDLDEFEDLLTDVLAVGVVRVRGVSFQTSEPRKYKDEARALAIEAAGEKGEALADSLDQEIGEPLSIVEEQNASYSWYSSTWGSSYLGTNAVITAQEGSLGEGATIAPGQITVSARVSVVFELK